MCGMSARPAREPLVTLERLAGVGYFHVRTRGPHPVVLGDIRGNRTLGFQAGPPGLTQVWAYVPTREQAVQTILDHTSEQP
jgi:hypothetical protein